MVQHEYRMTTVSLHTQIVDLSNHTSHAHLWPSSYRTHDSRVNDSFSTHMHYKWHSMIISEHFFQIQPPALCISTASTTLNQGLLHSISHPPPSKVPRVISTQFSIPFPVVTSVLHRGYQNTKLWRIVDGIILNMIFCEVWSDRCWDRFVAFFVLFKVFGFETDDLADTFACVEFLLWHSDDWVMCEESDNYQQVAVVYYGSPWYSGSIAMSFCFAKLQNKHQSRAIGRNSGASQLYLWV